MIHNVVIEVLLQWISEKTGKHIFLNEEIDCGISFMGGTSSIVESWTRENSKVLFDSAVSFFLEVKEKEWGDQDMMELKFDVFDKESGRQNFFSLGSVRINLLGDVIKSYTSNLDLDAEFTQVLLSLQSEIFDAISFSYRVVCLSSDSSPPLVSQGEKKKGEERRDKGREERRVETVETATGEFPSVVMHENVTISYEEEEREERGEYGEGEGRRGQREREGERSEREESEGIEERKGRKGSPGFANYPLSGYVLPESPSRKSPSPSPSRAHSQSPDRGTHFMLSPRHVDPCSTQFDELKRENTSKTEAEPSLHWRQEWRVENSNVHDLLRDGEEETRHKKKTDVGEINISIKNKKNIISKKHIEFANPSIHLHDRIIFFDENETRPAHAKPAAKMLLQSHISRLHRRNEQQKLALGLKFQKSSKTGDSTVKGSADKMASPKRFERTLGRVSEMIDKKKKAQILMSVGDTEFDENGKITAAKYRRKKERQEIDRVKLLAEQSIQRICEQLGQESPSRSLSPKTKNKSARVFAERRGPSSAVSALRNFGRPFTAAEEKKIRQEKKEFDERFFDDMETIHSEVRNLVQRECSPSSAARRVRSQVKPSEPSGSSLDAVSRLYIAAANLRSKSSKNKKSVSIAGALEVVQNSDPLFSAELKELHQNSTYVSPKPRRAPNSNAESPSINPVSADARPANVATEESAPVDDTLLNFFEEKGSQLICKLCHQDIPRQKLQQHYYDCLYG